jgi:hypothetical protein
VGPQKQSANYVIYIEFTIIQNIQPFQAHPNRRDDDREPGGVGSNPVIFKLSYLTKAAALKSPSQDHHQIKPPTTEVPCQHELTHAPPEEHN